MRRNCNLTLRLVPPSSNHHHHRRQEQPTDEVDLLGLDPNQNLNGNENQQQQQLTIFYNGKISVSDVSDFQARAIIKLASEEIEEKWRNRTPSADSPASPWMMLSPSPSPSPSPSHGGLSMKKSLQRFLQKRKHRLQATSPYHR